MISCAVAASTAPVVGHAAAVPSEDDVVGQDVAEAAVEVPGVMDAAERGAGAVVGPYPAAGEWAPALPAPAAAFPPLSDDITVARHRELAAQLMSQVSRGDTYAAGAWLRRLARDPSVHPWLLLDQLTLLSSKNSRPLGGSGARLVSVGGTGRGRAG